MTWLIFALGAGMAIAGGASIYLGYPYIAVEWGWTEVLAGTTLLSAGAVVIALGAVLLRLGALRRALAGSGLAGQAMTPARTPPAALPQEAVPIAALEDWGAGAPEARIASEARTAHEAHHAPEARGAQPALRSAAAPAEHLTEPVYEAATDASAFAPAETSRTEALVPSVAPVQASAEPPRGSLLATLRSRMNRARPEATPPGRRPLEPMSPAVDAEQDFVAAARSPAPLQEPDAAFAPFRTVPPAAPAPALGRDEAFSPPTTVDNEAPQSFAAREMATAAPALQPSYGAEDYAPTAEPEVPAAQEAPTVVGRYQAGGASYVLFSNGTIEVETDTGTHRFASMQDLKAFIERSA